MDTEFHFYILYSAKLDRYYLGHTGEELSVRLRKHLSSHGGYTSRAKDWVMKYSERYSDKAAAYAREREVKSWKSRERIEWLIRGGESLSD